jgi:hypothetical protein
VGCEGVVSGGNSGFASSPSSPEDIDELVAKGDEIFEQIYKKNPAEAKHSFVKKLAADPVPDNLFDNFYEASSEVDKVLLALENIDGSSAKLIKSTPGIGKTEAGLHLLSVKAKNKIMPFFATGTRNMAWQAYDRLKGGFFGFGHRVIMLEGRHGGYIRRRYEDDGSLTEIVVEPNCERYHDVCKAREKGYPAQHHVCAKCPRWPLYKDSSGNKTGFYGACEYFRDLYRAAGFVPFGDGEWAPIVITTHHMAACVITQSEVLKPKFLLIDEDIIAAMREIYVWDEHELMRLIDGDPLRQQRVLLREAIKIAKKFKGLSTYAAWTDEYKKLSDDDKELHKIVCNSSYDKDTLTLSGIGLHKVLLAAAKNLKVNLDVVLEAAAVSTTGVEKGEFTDMPEWRFQRLPHYKEPDLGFELQQVAEAAKKGEETAYKISLRKMKGENWGIHWDHVRRMNYGGPLVLLDAYGEKALYERVCNREVDVIEVKCRIRKNVTAHHYPIKTSRKVMDNEKNRVALFYEYVVPILRKSKGKKVLFYIQKRYAEWLEGMIAKGNFGLEAVVVKWFWMDRGDDSYGDFDKLVIFGSPFSNVVADMHFTNAMFAGEELLDFSKLPSGEYADERVRLLKQSREENEAMQALFRIRPAKPREDPQEMLIMSQIKLPISFEMPGAVKKMHYGPDYDSEGIAKGMQRLFSRFGFWTDVMAAFLYEVDGLVDWFDAGAMSSEQELMITHDELVHRMQVFRKNYFFKKSRATMFEVVLALKPKMIDYRGRKVRVWGDASKTGDFLEQLRLATREPGCDDDEHPEDDGQKPDSDVPPEPDEEQVQQEAKQHDDDSVYTSDALKLLSLLEVAAKDAADDKGGTGPPNTS